METKDKKEITLWITLEKLNTHEKIREPKVLLDCGAMGLFMDKKYAEEKGFQLRKLEQPVHIRNVDGTWNIGGEITHEVDLIMDYQEHTEKETFEICNLGKTNIIIGLTWLQKHNPTINWENGDVRLNRCPRSCGIYAKEYRKKKAENN